MDSNFITKIKKIILDYLDDENFGVSKLSSKIGLSRSQLLRKIKASTGKSANEFISDIHLEEAAKLIKEGNYSASEIAYKVGFSSPSYFFKCFHDHFGCTPGEYKALDHTAVQKTTPIAAKPRRSRFQRNLLVSIIILGIIIIAYVIFDNSLNQKRITQSPSIAVLPFKIMSDSIENQYLAEGLWDDLLNHLSKIKGLDVRSRQSVERYRLSDKSMTDIGEELNVAYIVESSFQRVEDNIRIITQLIDAKTDKHIWSDEHDYELNNTFEDQTRIAKQITKELNVVLTDEEVKSLETFPTNNDEAYRLFLQGKTIVDTRTKENLEAGIELFEQAIVLDPNFADAYAEMAHLYFLLGSYSYTVGNRNKIIELNERALSIDSNIPRVFTTRAVFNLAIGNWEKGKENYEKAIALDPYDAIARHHFALFYYAFKPIYDPVNHLDQIRIAQKLDPFSRPINNVLMYSLLENDSIQKAEEHFEKVNFIFPDFVKEEFRGLIMSEQKKDYTEAIKGILNALEIHPNDAGLHSILGDYYNEILNDDINFLKHKKRAYILEPKASNRRAYFRSLLENKKNIEAHRVLSNKDSMKLYLPNDQKLMPANYYYNMGDFAKALVYIDSTNVWFKYGIKAKILAKMGDIKRINDIFKNHQMRYREKALVFAILNETDSMYHYLNKMTSIFRVKALNGNNEFDPYRKEPRYKAFLKKHYLPRVN